MKITKKILLLFIVAIYNIQAQEIIPINLKEVTSKVLENNSDIALSKLDSKIAKATYKQSQAVFLPTVKVSHTGIATTNPLMAFGSKLNQEIITPSDFDPNLLNNPNTVNSFATKLEMQQPLINLDGIYQRKAAKTKMKAAELQTQRTKEYLSFELKKAYMELQLAYKAQEVFEKTLQAAEANKKLAEDNYKQGFLQKADLLAVKVRVNEVKNKLQEAKSNLLNASNYLSFLMNESQDVLFKPTDELTPIVFSNDSIPKISQNRADIRAMKLATQTYNNLAKADKMTFLPRLNAFASYELYDNKIFNTKASGYLVGAQLSWDILQAGKRFGRVQESKAQVEKATTEYQQYLSKSNLELNKAKRLLEDAKNSVLLTQLALEQSKESLRIRTNRYKEGLEKTSDLLQAESMFAQKQLAYYQSIFKYNYALAYIQFLTKE
jgi:outer membrane protein TolC